MRQGAAFQRVLHVLVAHPPCLPERLNLHLVGILRALELDGHIERRGVGVVLERDPVDAGEVDANGPHAPEGFDEAEGSPPLEQPLLRAAHLPHAQDAVDEAGDHPHVRDKGRSRRNDCDDCRQVQEPPSRTLCGAASDIRHRLAADYQRASASFKRPGAPPMMAS